MALELTWQNMLRSTVSDSGIKSIMGNEHEILPTRLELLQKFDHHLANTLGESSKILREENISTEKPANSSY